MCCWSARRLGLDRKFMPMRWGTPDPLDIYFSITRILMVRPRLRPIGDHLVTRYRGISKSGGTRKTRNGMLEAAAAPKRPLNFGKHAAVTGVEASWSVTREKRVAHSFSDARLGADSVMSAVGLVPRRSKVSTSTSSPSRRDG